MSYPFQEPPVNKATKMNALRRILSLIKRAAKWYWVTCNTPLTPEEEYAMQIW